LELEYKEEKGKLWHIKYPLKEGGFITIATTRPETMLGDSAIAVNPKDGRYEKLIGKTAVLPIMNREIPIVADRAVEKDFGTGAVKVTPAHDFTDAEIGERHDLPRYQIINERGKITELAGKEFEGLRVLEAREKVVEKLKGLGLIEKEEDYSHSVAHCYRCDSVIEPLISKQWFVKMDELAKIVTKEIRSGKIKYHPEQWEKISLDWLENIKDWCVSRQIWWGHQLPVWQCECQTDNNSKFRIQNSELAHQKLIVSIIKPKEKCEICNSEYKQISDVLDTWFSSALWPIATLGWPDKTKDFKEFYPTQVLSTARDILNLWVTRMIFSGLELAGEKPFSDVIIHATILNKEGKRMSKSLGTGVDPMILIEKYGADATRFGLIWQSMGGQDIRWAEEHVMAGKKFANKIWNITRFILMKTENGFNAKRLNEIKNGENKAIAEKLAVLADNTEKKINEYDFGQALHDIYEFVWKEFADKFIEFSKDKNDEETKNVLSWSLVSILKILHPFMPFVTEEIYGHLPIENKSLLIIEKWPTLS
jgi:valyl-tRNA synthetase